MILVTKILIFKGKFNLCNAHDTIGSCNLFKMLLLCSLDIHHVDNMSNQNYLMVYVFFL